MRGLGMVVAMLVGPAIAAQSDAGPARLEGPEAPARLRCEYLVNPLAIEVSAPRLSWEVRDEKRGAKQTAYRILVASRPSLLEPGQADTWDSGKVTSDETLQVEYRGKPLESGKRYYWKVRTWDTADQPSPWSPVVFWGMGLLKAEDWKASWIGDPAPPPPPSQPHMGYRSKTARSPDEQKWVLVDLETPVRIDAVRLFGARAGRANSLDIPGYLFPLRFRVQASRRADFMNPMDLVDRTGADVANPGVQPLTLRFASTEARYVRLLVTKLRPEMPDGYAFALAEMQVLAGDRNLAAGVSVAALDSVESEEWSTKKLVDGDIYWHGGGSVRPMAPPMLRREFTLSSPVRAATAYVTALGVYELFINGKRVGDHVLAPEWTDYSRSVQYQAYDVSSLLRAGANAIGVMLGDGWYAGRLGMTQAYGPMLLRGIYGRKPRFLMQMEIEVAGGSRQRIVTDGAWHTTTEGPIRTSDLYDGEVYDARREIPGWCEPGFRRAGWAPVEVGEKIRISLVAQPNEPIRVRHELKARRVAEPQPGVYVFDLGQNIVGRVRLEMHGRDGDEVSLRHGEFLDSEGNLYAATLRGAPQTDRYVLRGSPAREVFEPHFTSHGFRYVEVTGLKYKPRAEDLTGATFYSSAEQTGAFESSNALLNRLWQAIVWTQRGNMMGIFTDCPQRDERLGWLGDWQAFAHTSAFNMDMAAFVRKAARDIREAQFEDGRYPMAAPNVLQFSAAPGWSDGGILIPWSTYLHSADRRLLEDHFESARRWVEWYRGQCPDFIWRGAGIGDWLNGDTVLLEGYPASGASVSYELFGTAFFAQSARTLARMAAVLGRKEEERSYSLLFDSVRLAFQKEFVASDGRIQGDSQAAYALALHFGLVPEDLRPAAVGHMVDAVRRYGGRLSTGIQATHRLMLELSRGGCNDLAYELLNSRICPSWGYMLDQGATTIWERWDGYVAGRNLNLIPAAKLPQVLHFELPLETGYQTSSMTSFNHVAFGSVGEWIYRVILGIEPDEEQPGYKHFTVHPLPVNGLSYARGAVHSPHGVISVHWSIENARFVLRLTVPANTSATVWVPAGETETVKEGDREAKSAPGVRLSVTTSTAQAYDVSAGSYRFETRWK